MNRKGEKLGWTLGWLGSFLWLFIISIIFLFQSKFIFGILGFLHFILALVLTFVLSPWRNSKKKYWILMLPIYILMIMSVVLTIKSFGGIKDLSEIQYGLWILPSLIPIFLLGGKTWNCTADNKKN